MKKNLNFIIVWVTLICALSTCLLGETKVKLVTTPDNGIQPKVIVDASGVAHLVYYKGDASSGNIYYSKKQADGQFSAPTQVNSVSGSAVSMGTIRGAKFALDNDNRVHVVWNGSRSTKPEELHGPPMYYTRLKEDGSGFEEQRIITGHWPVDGGGAIGVDSLNRVFVFWHTGEEGAGDAHRSILARISHDNGSHFGVEQIISPKGTGVCGCCSMQATVDREDNVYVVYRTARNNKHRDINLLMSKNGGASFSDKILDTWELEACPMSSMSFGETRDRILVGWETNNQIRFTALEKGVLTDPNVLSPDQAPKMKHPVFASSPEGQVLLVWTEGTGWKKGGTIAWKKWDDSKDGMGKVHRSNAEVPVWSFLAAYYDQHDDTFYVLH